MMEACWNRIGVRGDRSCPDLAVHVHCRNCPVHADAAARALDRTAPALYLAEWTRHVSRPLEDNPSDARPVVLFRVAGEWLALPAAVVVAFADPRPIHSLPHRTGRGGVIGVTSARGELIVAVSLASLLDVGPAAEPASAGARAAYARHMVLTRGPLRVACPVDEVYGLHAVRPADVRAAPATLGQPARHVTGVIAWRQRAAAVLDDAALFGRIAEALA